MNRFILALQFLTVFRLKKDAPLTEEDLSASMAYFPLVGLIQGLILAGADFVLSALGVVPDSIINGLLILILVLVNGGLHIDGFADTIDGLAGGSTPEERLRIMKDSSVGAIGVVFIVILLLLKFLALEELPEEVRLRALAAFPAVSRWAIVPMSYLSSYARPEGGLGAAFTGIRVKTLVMATVIAAVISALALGILSLVLIVFIGALTYGASRFFKKRLNGVTGDVLGFQSETIEAVFLLSVIVLVNILAEA